MIPTIPQIVTAARLTAQTNPRPLRAFWLAACRGIVEPDPESLAGYRAALAFCMSRSFAPGHLDKTEAQTIALRHLEAMGETDLRAAFVELSIYASPNEDAARLMWAEALDIRDEDGGPW